jgi:hypothetical protein
MNNFISMSLLLKQLVAGLAVVSVIVASTPLVMAEESTEQQSDTVLEQPGDGQEEDENQETIDETVNDSTSDESFFDSSQSVAGEEVIEQEEDENQETIDETVNESEAPPVFKLSAVTEEKVSATECQNLFENGSFENPEVVNSSLWQKFTSVAGWLIERVSDAAPTTLEVHKGWSGNVSAEGSQYIELDGDHSTQISQTVSTIIGAEYDLVWAFAPRHDITADQNKLEVLVNGGLVGSNGPATGVAPLASTDWVYSTFSFVATSSNTTFTFRDAGASNSFGTFLDDTQLCLVQMPEPETETIKVCKLDAFENPVSGWGVTITNDKTGEDEVSFELETGENGCVEQEVNPEDGPFYVIEEMRDGWNQVDVWADSGIVEEGQGSDMCVFFKPLMVVDGETTARVAEVLDEEWDYTPTCYFMNEEDEDPAPICNAELNLIVNGSFEEPGLDEDGFGWDVFESVIGGLTWIVNWLNPAESSPETALLELQGGYYTASHGVQYAELDSNWIKAPGGVYNGEDARVIIHQDIETIPGNTYTVSYDFSALPRRGADNNVLQVLLDTNQVNLHAADGTELTDTSWTTYSYTFVATSTSAKIGFADAGLADSFGTLLDNVSVRCTPEEDDGGGDNGGGSSGGSDTPERRSGGGSVIRPTATPTVAGESTTPAPLVLGEQVSVVPAGAPGAGHGGGSNFNNLNLLGLMLLNRRVK